MTESDFNYLNGLADGELSQAETEHWKQRVAADPQANIAYEKILSVKRKLAAHSNIETVAPAGVMPKARSMGIIALPIRMVAASAAIFVCVAGLWFVLHHTSKAQPTSMLAWHKQFSTHEYVVSQTAGPLFVSLGQSADIPVPNLEPSKLYLVDTEVINRQESQKQALFHYRGLSGCRLTIWVKVEDQEFMAQGIANFRQWLVGNTRFGIIATGMDKARFASIAAYVESVTRQSKRTVEVTRLAMVDTYEKAERCA